MIRIGITQRVEHLADRNERRDCLDQEWSRLLVAENMIPIPLPNRAHEAATLVEQLELEGLILSGGNDLSELPGASNTAPERDAFERALLELARQQHLPVLGVCRGLQMMVTDAGGRLGRVTGHVARPHTLEVVAGQNTIEPRPLVNSFHNFAVSVDDMNPDWRPLAMAPDGTVEAISHRVYPQLAIMWHPERAPHDPRDATLIRNFFSTTARAVSPGESP